MNQEAFFKITYGLFIISSNFNKKLSGHISNTVFQVSAEPPKIAICSNKKNLTTDLMIQSNSFAVCVIQENVDLEFIGHFGFKSGRDFDKFKDINYKLSSTNSPIVLDKTIAFLDCTIENTIDVGTHQLFIAKVVDADILQTDTKPLTYAYYRNVIKGISPENSPTYIKKESINNVSIHKEEEFEQKYKCQICGYVYDSAIGDLNSQINKGTLFQDIPDDWTCPICCGSKSVFVEI